MLLTLTYSQGKIYIQVYCQLRIRVAHYFFVPQQNYWFYSYWTLYLFLVKEYYLQPLWVQPLWLSQLFDPLNKLK